MDIKKIVSVGLVALLLIAFYCCEAVDGKCTPTNFSPDVVILNKNKQSKTIHSSKNVDWWNFYCIRVDNVEVPMDKLKISYEAGKEKNISNIKKIEGEWFTLEKVNNKTIKISVTEASKDRGLSFEAYSGNCWQEIHVRQFKDE